MNGYTIWLILCLLTAPVVEKENTKWDDNHSTGWPTECKQITITSSADGNEQPAYYFRCISRKPRPLIVSLHTWSGDFTQDDPLARQCIADDYNYIHPNFRGPNRTPQACGSDLVISDIDDAIDYAINNAPVDTNSIHVIGVSGGGYATELTYMK
jgi:pimeloyl-ACP methyl ester carboxylesterase